jgi:hypothetical protein
VLRPGCHRLYRFYQQQFVTETARATWFSTIAGFNGARIICLNVFKFLRAHRVTVRKPVRLQTNMIFHCFILVVIFPVSFSSVFHCQIWASLLFCFYFIFFRWLQFLLISPKWGFASSAFKPGELQTNRIYFYHLFFCLRFCYFRPSEVCQFRQLFRFHFKLPRGKNRGLFRSHFPCFFH